MKNLSNQDQTNLLRLLEARFHQNRHLHSDIIWEDVLQKLIQHPQKLWSINQMELTGGEPDVIQFNENDSEIFYCDCSIESPSLRRSLCYDEAALIARKVNKPIGNAVATAMDMGIQLLNENQYRHLQSLGKFDLKTSSWIDTPDAIRNLKGALFGDRRYDHVFIYHNGAESYYAARGFRGQISL